MVGYTGIMLTISCRNLGKLQGASYIEISLSDQWEFSSLLLDSWGNTFKTEGTAWPATQK